MNEHKSRTAHDLGERPLCPICNENVRKFIAFSKKDGRPLFRKTCRSCGGMQAKKRPYHAATLRKKKTMKCEKCGFKAEDSCQLDVDHIDGNHDNNDPSNHQILCANCHRLKTKRNKDFMSRKETPK